jgi:hypothetical protein
MCSIPGAVAARSVPSKQHAPSSHYPRETADSTNRALQHLHAPALLQQGTCRCITQRMRTACGMGCTINAPSTWKTPSTARHRSGMLSTMPAAGAAAAVSPLYHAHHLHLPSTASHVTATAPSTMPAGQLQLHSLLLCATATPGRFTQPPWQLRTTAQNCVHNLICPTPWLPLGGRGWPQVGLASQLSVLSNHDHIDNRPNKNTSCYRCCFAQRLHTHATQHHIITPAATCNKIPAAVHRPLSTCGAFIY